MEQENQTEKVELEIRGEKITIRCPLGESDSYRRAAKKVTEEIGNLQSLTGNRLDQAKVLSLVAVNFCHELMMKEKEFSNELATARKRVETIISQIDSIGENLS